MPDMTPVADQIQPPDPMRGINTYAGILGIKQRQQAIQGQAAQVQQEQLKAQQAQGVQNFFKSWDPTDHIADDGTTDLDSAMQSPQFKAGGNAKPAIMQSLLDIKNKQLTNKQSLATLNGTLVNQLGTQVGALAKDDDVVADKTDPETGVNPGRAKVDAYFKQFAQLGPDAARVAQIYQPMVDHAPPGKLSHGVAALQMQAEDVGGQQAQQNPATGILSTGSQHLPYTVNKATGVPAFTGQHIGAGIPPGWSLTEDPATHNKYMVNQQTGQSKALTGQPLFNVGGGAAAQGNGAAPPGAPAPPAAPPQRAPGQAEAQAKAFGAVGERVQQAQAAANQMPQAIDALTRAKTILEQPGSPNTGGLFNTLRGVGNYLSGMGVDTKGASDANSLLKNLARYEASRATAVGLGGTDAARELAHNGSPNTTLDNNALLGIVNQSLATEKAMASYANKQAKTNDPAQWQKNEATFRSIPNVIEGYQYGMSRNGQEADRFLGDHGIHPKDMAQTRQQIKDFESQ